MKFSFHKWVEYDSGTTYNNEKVDDKYEKKK